MQIDSAEFKAELDKLPTSDIQALLWRVEWEKRRHKHQIEPTGDWWTLWLQLAGRGSGKTRGASEDTGWYAFRNPGSRQLVAAPTSGDLRDVCFEGESGLLRVIPKILVKDYNRSLHEIIVKTIAGESLIKGIPASEPERFRGPQWHRFWGDEPAAWQYAQESLDMIMMSLRLGQKPRGILTTTPKPSAFIRGLVKREGKDVVITRASTYANLANLAPTFKDQLLRYEGTALGRQEIHAELLDPEEQGIVKRSQIRMWPASKQLPWFDFIVMSLDTALTEETRDKETGDPDYTACTVWGLFQHEKRANAMMLDAWQARMGMPEMIARVKDEMKSEYGQMETPILRPLIGPAQIALEVKKIDLLLIEGINGGKVLLQVLASQGINGYSYHPGREKKLDRLHAVSHLFAGGSSKIGVVWMTEGRRREKDGSYSHTGDFSSWAHPVIDQLATFSGEGSIPHDDFLDSAVQALRLLSDRNMLDTIRNVPDPGYVSDARPTKDAPQNPYAA